MLLFGTRKPSRHVNDEETRSGRAGVFPDYEKFHLQCVRLSASLPLRWSASSSVRV